MIDIHTETAMTIFGVTEDQVTPKMRSKAKAINTGLLYGAGPEKLKKILDGISLAPKMVEKIDYSAIEIRVLEAILKNRNAQLFKDETQNDI